LGIYKGTKILMRQDPQIGQHTASNSIKYLYWSIEDAQRTGVEYIPFFYVEARIDFNDVRTGFSSMISLSKAIELHSFSADLPLVADMIRDIDLQNTSATMPDSARLSRLPDFVDEGFMSQMETQFVRYLLNSFKSRVYRNFELDVYSNAGESLSGFTSRCMDLLDGARRRESDNLHEVFNRKLGQIEQKYLNANSPDDFEVARTASRNRDIFSDYLEKIAGLFLQSKPVLNSDEVGSQKPRSSLELEERLMSLAVEAKEAIAELWDSYEEKARSVDEYVLHANLKDIHLVRSCILWIPAQAA
jgi:hypothetical protein